ncbi:MAG: hypothetical protein WCF17_02985 [Terracidiphilus sp.]
MSQEDEPRTPLRGNVPLPGVLAISLYLLLLAGTIVVGVVGHHYAAIYLVFAAVFVSASAGLIVGFRWAWVLALSAVFLLMSYNFWIFAAQHAAAMAVQGLLNLVFFLYLVRPEVRARLR